MTEFNPTSFLDELDSFGRPPPVQKIIGDSGADTIAARLNMINLDKQKKIRGEMIVPGNNGMMKLASRSDTRRIEEIKDADVKKWRNDVLSMSRPRIQVPNTESAQSARDYARKVARGDHYGGNSESEEDQNSTRSSSASNSLPSPPNEISLKTIRHERKSSDYSSASSQKSPSPPSQSSYSDYASVYKSDSQKTSPVPRISYQERPESPTKAFNRHFRQTSPQESLKVQGPPTQKKTKDLSLSEIISKKTGASPGGSQAYGGMSLTQQVRLGNTRTSPPLPPPPGKPPGFRPVADDNRRTAKWKEINNALETEDKQFKRLTEQLRKDLVAEKKHVIGTCTNCQDNIYDTQDRYTVDERTYHTACFTCDVCGKELREQQFYQQDDRLYCKQDYLYKVEKRETLCAACRTPIQEMVLTVLNKKYHPACFCCTDCNLCLDGVPFAIDKDNKVFCMPDYHNRYAPRCATCKKPIMPENDSGETVRIVALDNSYHVNCYVCEGCSLPLTDDPNSRCYPLGRHLLCEKCHIHWRRTGDAPLTDL